MKSLHFIESLKKWSGKGEIAQKDKNRNLMIVIIVKHVPKLKSSSRKYAALVSAKSSSFFFRYTRILFFFQMMFFLGDIFIWVHLIQQWKISPESLQRRCICENPQENKQDKPHFQLKQKFWLLQWFGKKDSRSFLTKYKVKNHCCNKNWISHFLFLCSEIFDEESHKNFKRIS